MLYKLQVEALNLEGINSVINTLLEHGLLGVMIVICLYVIYYLNNSFKKERQLLNDRIEKFQDARTEDFKESNKDLRAVIDRYHDFISELRTLINNKG